MELNSKVDINVGYRCNAECVFCYYKPSVKLPFFDAGLVKRQLRFARRIGVRDIDFTGGEPTVNKDLTGILEYAASLGFRKLCLITNGIVLSDMEYFKRLKGMGITDVLFSLHGYSAEKHDALVGVAGGFEKCVRAVKNARELAVRYRINSVIVKGNYMDLPKTARLIGDLAPAVVSFINMNPCASREVYNDKVVARLSDLAPYLGDAIDILKERTDVNAMYVPFCFMEGRGKYLRNMRQIQYDPDEWDYLARAMVQNGAFKTMRFVLYRGVLRMPASDFSLNMSDVLHRAMITALCRKHNTVLDNSCAVCRYKRICDGPWKDYVGLYGDAEFKAVQGPPVTDPVTFMKEARSRGE